jgi:hypothetical protein
MTTTAGSSPQIDAYLAAVREALGDLAEDERADLLAEVEASLVESVGESPGTSPLASLGPPEEFAAELRASAGLGEPTDARPASPGGLDALRALARSVAERPGARAAARVGRELAPAWWLVRGYLLVVAFASVTGARWSLEHPWLPHLPSARTSIVLIVAAVIVSLAAGLRLRGATPWVVAVMLAIDVVALLAVVPVERHARRGQAPTTIVEITAPAASTPGGGLVDDGRPITNVYAYSRSGALLLDTLLYDQDGRQIRLALGPDPLRRILRGVSDQVVPNVFPIRYYDAAGTRRVAHPAAGPHVRVPKIVTPPLAP